jgi:tetratricopeptide (TPR) repeat protein
MRAAVLMATLLVAEGVGGVAGEGGAPLERWLYNPRERTRAGLAALRAGEAATAAERLAAAARLAPHDPLTRFNSGTGRLAAGEAARAAAELARAAELADGELEARALYNLGNAHAAGGDWRAAREAYQQALRLDPEPLDAKVNLELALRRQAEQEERERQQQDQPQEQQQQREEQEPSSGGEQEQPAPSQPQSDDPAGGGTGQSTLPNFEEQPDMTAEQAAAILEAVENMEREQRRQAAAQRARELPANERDW